MNRFQQTKPFSVPLLLPLALRRVWTRSGKTCAYLTWYLTC